MKHDPIFLEPTFQEMIWGGSKLRDRFGYDIPSDHTGECWGISAHEEGMSTVKGGPYTGHTLAELWESHRDLFGDETDDIFPLLVKIIDANRDLSVQVHPDDAYASENAPDERGKTECWYIMDCQQGAEIIYGHNANSHEELKQMIDNGDWGTLLRKRPIQPGDFISVPTGTVHALPAGTLVLETQQNSDTTYRLYDYDRTDDNGERRELHIRQALDVIQVPHEDASVAPETYNLGDTEITHYIENEAFGVSRWRLDGTSSLEQEHKYLLVTVLEGEGRIKANGQEFPFQKGDHFILPSGIGKFDATGKATGFFSYSL